MDLHRQGIAVMASSFLLGAPSALAQELVVQPSTSTLYALSDLTILQGEGEDPLPDGWLQLEALFVSELGIADVTASVDWSVEDADVATLDPQTARLTPVGEGHTRVVATLGSIEAEMPVTVRWNEPQPGVPLVLQADAEGGEAIPRSVLRNAAESFVQGLGDFDVPNENLTDAVNNTTIADDRNAFAYDSGGLGGVTGEETGALFVPKGTWFDLTIGGFPPQWVDGRALWTPVDVIVLRPDIAESLANGEMFSSSGLSDNGQVVLEELMHAALHQHGVRLSREAEEDIVGEFTTQIVPAMIRVTVLLDKPFSEWTQQDVTNFRTNVNFNIRQQIQDLRQKWGDEAVDEFLEALGWEDSDGDGIPDWFEDLLRDHGLDSDNLPETPEDLPEEEPEDDGGDDGGGGPGLIEPADKRAPLPE